MLKSSAYRSWAKVAWSILTLLTLISNFGRLDALAVLTITPDPNSLNVANLNGIYEIVNRNSGKVLDVTGRSKEDGAFVQQWTNFHTDNQRWRLELQSDGTYKITSVNSGKVLDIEAANTSRGAAAIQWSWHGANNQRWSIVNAGSGYVKLFAKHSNKLLGVNAARTVDGARIIQWDDTGALDHQWQLVRVDNTPVPGSITYNLSQPGRVSIAVYNAQGQIVRTLLNAAQRNAGSHTEMWDGKDDAGNLLPSGTYTWKLLETPQGLTAEYLMALGSNLPAVSGHAPNHPWLPKSEGAEYGLGNHTGARSITIDTSLNALSNGIYLGAGISENVSNGVKLSLDGNQRLWSANQPAVWAGRFALSVMNGFVYHLEQSGDVGAHGVDDPNWPFASVGNTGGDHVGFRWNALWQGLRGEYYNNANLTGVPSARKKIFRTDETVNFNWGTGAPHPNIEPNTYSVRWTGRLTVPQSGEYKFITTSDDGVRLWIRKDYSDKLIIDNWTVHSPTENTGQITLEANQSYDLKLEYYNGVGGAQIKLEWQKPDGTREIIPRSRFTYSHDWSESEQSMDLAAFDPKDYNSAATANPQLIISYRDHNVVQWRDPRTGAVLDSASIVAPKGVAIDNNGNLLVLSQDKLLRLSRANKTPVVVKSNLSAPFRLDVDRSTNEILVVEHGASQQIKRFTAAGALVRTYGKEGGRRTTGLYDPAGFVNVNDIAADNQGGFIIAEDEQIAPRRVLWLNRDGNTVKEWYTGQSWTPQASPEPDNPSVVWMAAPYNDSLMRMTLNYADKTWQVHSTYDLYDLPEAGMLQQGYKGLVEGGAGIHAWKARNHEGVTFLVKENGPQIEVLRLEKGTNEQDWRLVPAVVGNFRAENRRGKPFLWTDVNGDGVAQEAEFRDWSARGMMNLRPDQGLNYVYYDRWAYFNEATQSGGAVYKFEIEKWNRDGQGKPLSPVYYLAPKEIGRLPQDYPTRLLYEQGQPHRLSAASNGDLFHVSGLDQARDANGNGIFASTKQWRVIKWDGQGQMAWQLKGAPTGNYDDRSANHTAGPGQVWATFMNPIGIVNGSIVVADFNGGYDGLWRPWTYVWDRDGLWVGGLFEQVADPNLPTYQYSLSSHNGSGDLWTDPATGDVLYFGGSENEVRVYRITGWNNWQRLSGSVTTP